MKGCKTSIILDAYLHRKEGVVALFLGDAHDDGLHSFFAVHKAPCAIFYVFQIAELSHAYPHTKLFQHVYMDFNDTATQRFLTELLIKMTGSMTDDGLEASADSLVYPNTTIDYLAPFFS